MTATEKNLHLIKVSFVAFGIKKQTNGNANYYFIDIDVGRWGEEKRDNFIC